MKKKCKFTVKRGREGAFRDAFPGSIGEVRRQSAAELEVEIQAPQAGEERRGSSASQSNGCCFDPAVLEQVLAFRETRAANCIHFMQQEFVRQYRASGVPEQGRSRRERSLGRRLG